MDGEQHNLATKIGILAHSAGAIYLSSAGYSGALGMIAGSLLPLICTPDLDQEQHATVDEQVVYRINPILGTIWRQFWYNYGLAIPHRHRLSHGVPLGTIVRAAYLLVPYSFWRIYGVHQGYLVPILVALYVIVPRLIWRDSRGRKRKCSKVWLLARPGAKVFFLVLPTVFALALGMIDIRVDTWMLYAFASWVAQDMLHLILDRGEIYG